VARPFLIAQLSDPHIGATWTDADPADCLAATVEAVRPHAPDAVLVTGDIADHATPGEYAVARELLARIGAPVYVLPGNHDDRGALRAAFDLPGAGPVNYAVDLDALRLVVLDSTIPGEDRGRLGAQDLEWLDGALDGRPAVVALHHPPLVLGIPPWDAIGLSDADRAGLAAVLERHPRVEAVVGGHIHRPITGVIGGRVALSIPSTYVQGRLDFEAQNIVVDSDEPPAFALHALVDGRLVSHVHQV
jgi:3',5'-cyclic AMP phosphodiesterase CpdA